MRDVLIFVAQQMANKQEEDRARERAKQERIKSEKEKRKAEAPKQQAAPKIESVLAKPDSSKNGNKKNQRQPKQVVRPGATSNNL